MANNKIWFGMMVLVFGMMIIGCDDDSTDEEDIWTDVTSLSQINGTWKGSYTYTTDSRDYEGITIKLVVEETKTVNAAMETISSSYKDTRTFSGRNISTEEWDEIKAWYEEEYEYDGYDIKVNDSNHIIVIDFYHIEFSNNINLSDYQINQNGTKLKIFIEYADSTEVIYTKQ